MKKIKTVYLRIVAAVCNFFGIGLVLGCDLNGNGKSLWPLAPAMYGSPPSVSGYVYGDIDGDGKTEPVKGIQVTASNDESVKEITTEDGYYCFITKGKDKIQIIFTDVDGEQNGSFKTSQAEITPEVYANGWGGNVNLDVNLERD